VLFILDNVTGYEIVLSDIYEMNMTCIRIILNPPTELYNSSPKNLTYKFTLKDPLLFQYNSKPFEYTLYFGKVSIQSLTYCNDKRQENCLIKKSSTNFIEIGIKSSNSKINFNSHKNGKFFLLLELES
jgi:hypothetical protein